MIGPGTLLGGRYRLEERLGRGGMGEVWSALDQGLDRQVAIKILLAELDGDPALIARLRREAKAAAALQHPGITVVHDLGEHDGHPYFVMELLEGTTFSALLTANPDGLPIPRTLLLMAQVADALSHAHRKGVVHRDIKPANLMELAEGGVKICDFGISRYADATTQLTATGGVLGTPAYMAPEQYEGKEADARTDLYAFGCTLHALLTGRPPFPGPSMANLMRQHLTEPPPRLATLRPDVPAELDGLVLRLLAKDPDERPATAGEVSDALRSLADLRPRPGGVPTPQTPVLGDRAKPGAGRVARTRTGGQGTGRPSTSLTGHTGPVGAVVFSPDGKTLATASWDTTARLWDVTTGKTTAIITDHRDLVSAVVFSPDGRTLATASWDTTVRLWDVTTGRSDILTGHRRPVYTVAFAPDGTRLASAGADETVRLWTIG